MNWELLVPKHVRRSIIRLPRKDQIRIVAALELLALNPFSGDIQKIKNEQNSWRRRTGAYRIFYEIFSKSKIIAVYRVERRASNTYRKV